MWSSCTLKSSGCPSVEDIALCNFHVQALSFNPPKRIVKICTFVLLGKRHFVVSSQPKSCFNSKTTTSQIRAPKGWFVLFFIGQVQSGDFYRYDPGRSLWSLPVADLTHLQQRRLIPLISCVRPVPVPVCFALVLKVFSPSTAATFLLLHRPHVPPTPPWDADSFPWLLGEG